MENLFVNVAEVVHSWLTGLGAPWVTQMGVILFKAVAILAFVLLNVLYLTFLERKIGAYMQQRPGPNRVGPRGLLQAVADTLKLLGKEDVVPRAADPHVFRLAIYVVFAASLMLYPVIPFGKDMIPVDLNLGIFYFIAISSTATIAFLMAGWSSCNKYALLGGMRTVAQMVSYEIPLAFSLLGVIMLTGSLKMSAIVAAQQNLWFIVLQPLAFIIYFISATAELNRGPFDLPEGEQEIVAGPFIEYSGMRWAMFFLAEYANLVAVSAIAVTLFLGGWQGPWLPSWLWFIIKLYGMIYVFMWVRWTFPRIRIDHMMNLNWKFLLPAALVNILVTGVGIKLYQWYQVIGR